ncbi:MAG TPA: glycosyltransferase family 4 protein [Methanothrix sp.]|nr:glycosyltransferase family 4 protein [Methanothrix sp.]HPJ83958.1 glycosyltransferase family 4 protein [Methanothrix sp.]
MIMLIAYFSLEFPPRVFGGLGVYADSISRELAALGQKISVFTMGDGELKRRQTRRGISIFRETPEPMRDGWEPFLSARTHAWGEGVNFLFDLMSYNQLAAASLRDNGPFDLVVAHDWLGLPGAMAAKRSENLPLIFHVHSLEVGRETAPNPQIVDLEVRGASLADGVITVSMAMKEQLASLGIPKDKIDVCYHGVETDVFSPSKVKPKKIEELRERYAIEEGDEVILFVGRLEPVKGVVPLIEAMPMVLKEHPRAKLLVVGKGTLEERVKSMAETLGGSVKVITDFLDLEAKIHHYALADLCVFPSLYEPFGIVGVEAAAMERPAVVGASGVSGLREIVDNPSSERPTGVHVNPHDPGDIAWGINLVLEDPERMREWGRNGRKKCLDIFNWPRAAKETLEIYEKVISSRR